MNHTSTPYRIGKLGKHPTTMVSIVSDDPTGLEKVGGATGGDAVDYYGGNLIAESVTPENAEFIVKACNAYEGQSEICERFIQAIVAVHLEGQLSDHHRPLWNCRNRACQENYALLKRLGRDEEFANTQQ